MSLNISEERMKLFCMDSSLFKEISIPTFYGDEVSHVNGLEYAREIIWDTLKYRRKNGVSGGSKLGNKS